MLMDQYADALQSVICQIRDTQREKILQAAQIVSKTICEDGLIYVFGCGHSQFWQKPHSWPWTPAARCQCISAAMSLEATSTMSRPLPAINPGLPASKNPYLYIPLPNCRQGDIFYNSLTERCCEGNS